MELVPSRGCRHRDWWRFPQSSIESCVSCGFTLSIAANPTRDDPSEGLPLQPETETTFGPARSQPLLAHSHDYAPLNLAHGRQIRILVLKAGRPSDPLRCQLEHVNLQQGPIYEALSYTWADAKGDDSLCKTIAHGTNGKKIRITANCEAALILLRRHDTDRRLWVDAVCIDQSNIQERNHQVKNMIAIFRSATSVLVYLGQGSHILSRLVNYISNDTAGQLPQVFDFVSLYRSRWFHRVWIIQEIAVAKDVLVVYGDNRMSWKDLVEHSNLFLRMMAGHNLPLVLPPVMSYGLQQTTMSSRRLQGVCSSHSFLFIDPSFGSESNTS
jgi:hypothetical protein